jgi:site-specific DNA-methyltransferase (adenine-specific)
VIQLFNGECLETLATLPHASVDMILCDLPYGTTACQWDVIIPFAQLWTQYHRVCKKSAAMVFTSSQPFTTKLVMSNFSEFRYEWKWIKPSGTNFLMSKKQPMKVHEDVIAFWRADPTCNEQPCDSDILRIGTERGEHPTQKPVALMEHFIRVFTNEGDTVLDNTMGSGTTGIACQNLGRHFIGIESSPEIYANAVERNQRVAP